jgi:hypothetical protein
MSVGVLVRDTTLTAAMRLNNTVGGSLRALASNVQLRVCDGENIRTMTVREFLGFALLHGHWIREAVVPIMEKEWNVIQKAQTGD